MSMISPRSLVADVLKLYSSGIAKGHDTGWPSVDAHFTVKAGEFTVLTGMPSHGKSEWLDNLLVNLAMKHNYRIAIFSPENYPLSLHVSKILEKYNQAKFFGARRMKESEMLAALDEMSKSFSFCVPKETAFTPTDIMNECLPWLQQSITQPRLLVIDPWNEMDHYRPAGLSETEYISRTLTELRRAAREFQTHLVLVAHPTKMQKNKDGGYDVPKPYDISGSSHWFNKADNCIAIWRDVMNRPELTEVHIQQVRFQGTGKPGMVELIYDREINSFVEPRPFNNVTRISK